MSETPWPTPILSPTDRFVDGYQPDWHLNACIGRQLPSGRRGMHHYCDGFRAAARRLAEQLVEGENRIDLPVDLAVYPILFLYRHHFELILKLLIASARSFLRDGKGFPKGHELDALWETARPLLERCFPAGADWSQNVIVTELLNELSAVDPAGQAGRYPEDIKGQKHFEHLSLLNVRHFADVSERLSDYLAEILFAIEVTDDERSAWEAEMMRDFS